MRKIVACKVSNGKAEGYDVNGQYVSTLCSDALSANANGDVVSVSLKNGKVEIYDANTGQYKRTL